MIKLQLFHYEENQKSYKVFEGYTAGKDLMFIRTTYHDQTVVWMESWCGNWTDIPNSQIGYIRELENARAICIDNEK